MTEKFSKTDKRILKRAILKVWDREATDDELKYLLKQDFVWVIQQRYKGLIFSHDFAKLFFGDNLICEKCGTDAQIKTEHGDYGTILSKYPICNNCPENEGDFIVKYLYCLAEMVKEERPLAYLALYL